MPILTNATEQPIKATSGHTVPANGTLQVTGATLERLYGDRFFAGQLRRGNVLVSADPQPEPEPEITRETIAKAKRAELVEIITGTGEYTEDDLEGVYVEDSDGEEGLRSMAAALLFEDE